MGLFIFPYYIFIALIFSFNFFCVWHCRTSNLQLFSKLTWNPKNYAIVWKCTKFCENLNVCHFHIQKIPHQTLLLQLFTYQKQDSIDFCIPKCNYYTQFFASLISNKSDFRCLYSGSQRCTLICCNKIFHAENMAFTYGVHLTWFD